MSLSLDEVISFVEAKLIENGDTLSDVDKIVLKSVWDDRTYAQISEDHGVPFNTLQTYLGPSLWRRLSNLFGKKVGKKSFKRVLTLEIAEDLRQKTIEQAAEEFLPIGASLPSIDNFVGREQEVEELFSLVNKFSCVFIIGLEGIGKKSLAAKMLHSKQSELSQYRRLWKPLHHRPSPEILEEELLASVGSAEGEGLLDRLQTTPHLIVLDALDSLLTQEAGRRALPPPYEVLLKRIAEETLSKLIVISTQPTEATDNLVLRERAIMYNLSGLSLEETKAVLGKQWKSKAAKEIWETTGGNPLMLRELSKWKEYASDLTPELHRLTVFSGLMGNFYEKVLERLKLSSYDMNLLKEVASRTQGIPFSQLLSQFPASIAHIGYLSSMGLVSVEKASLAGETIVQTTPMLKRALVGS